MTSTDIGVSETSSTPVGHSLQLAGSGSVYEDFTWQGPQANSFGPSTAARALSAEAAATG